MSSQTPWDQPAGPPPPPPPASVPPPPPPAAPGGPPPAPPGWPAQAAPPGWSAQTRPPRPKAPTAAGLMIGGAVLMVIGSFLTWFSIDGQDVTGFTELAGDERDGPVFVGFGVILAAFGITTLAARRLLPIAILAVIFAGFGVIFSLADYSDISDFEEVGLVEAGPGVPIVIIGSLIALAGGIVALAKRRR